jgi:hypothetical protein
MLSKMDRSPTLEDRNSNVRFGAKADMRPAKSQQPFRYFIELQSCPRRLAVPEQTVGAPAVVELSEPGRVSERVFLTLPA